MGPAFKSQIQNVTAQYDALRNSRRTEERIKHRRGVPRQEQLRRALHSPGEDSYKVTSPQDAKRSGVSTLAAEKKALSGVRGFGLAIHGPILWWCAFFQFIFGIVSSLGFALAASVANIAGDSLLGKVVKFFLGFGETSIYEKVGFAFWVCTLIITCALTFFYLVYFSFMQIPVLSESLLGTVTFFVCLGLNILAITNIFPWLELWIFYQLLKSSLGTLGSLSSSGTRGISTA